MPKVRGYYLKAVDYVEGKRAAEAQAKKWETQGLVVKVLPGIDPKCRANHYQPGFGGYIDQVCPECGGYIHV